ncbi:MAG: hypothetical protein JRJ10_16115 [Deltaproteobacteria bacterium]|nr:hypothetical protein [Deltaproteobacteria bacterium]
MSPSLSLPIADPHGICDTSDETVRHSMTACVKQSPAGISMIHRQKSHRKRSGRAKWNATRMKAPNTSSPSAPERICHIKVCMGGITKVATAHAKVTTDALANMNQFFSR